MLTYHVPPPHHTTRAPLLQLIAAAEPRHDTLHVKYHPI